MWGRLAVCPNGEIGSAIAVACQSKLPNSTVISQPLAAYSQTNEPVCCKGAFFSGSNFRKVGFAFFHKRRHGLARRRFVQHFGKKQSLVSDHGF